MTRIVRPTRRDIVRLALGMPLLGCEAIDRALLSSAEVPAPSGPVTPDHAWPTRHLAPAIPQPPDGWKLEVRALRGTARLLTLAEVMALPRVDVRLRMYCIEGWTAVADWTGVRLADLAALVGVKPDLHRYVELRSFDAPDDVARAYWSSWDLASALHPQTVVAYARNGKPLSPAAGAPLRLVAAVKRGYKQVKYLREINFVDRRTGGYWENRGHDWFGGV